MVAEVELILQGNMQDMLLWHWQFRSQKVPTSQPPILNELSSNGASLVMIRTALAMRPVMLPVQA